jgi:hypothetical protein
MQQSVIYKKYTSQPKDTYKLKVKDWKKDRHEDIKSKQE